MTADVLVVIDAQQVFADPESPWGSPMFAEAWPHIEKRVRSYGARVVVTRFVAPAMPEGAWVPYYKEWPFALEPSDSQLYQLVPGLEGRQAVDETTFGKWGAKLRAAIADARSVELVGVATDCCVISTALPMADAGIAVTVPAEACAGSTPDNHAKALDVMALYGPLITVER
ncbi:cysteine hydrolase family protein [Luteipulveratus mongoliensis]|uniref:Isochorismatase-like domain-containing protein n=1 Tax=Luteipulveratus mongoliensis TaxID=571913 RepID=A0A0K1JEP1_9MICO|nr:cysteine hydrolase [Luteipulveratus mongoliensis]AKU15171.1 hypothetical protein VV02_03675 [Luteipulveratus mongoliensis]